MITYQILSICYQVDCVEVDIDYHGHDISGMSIPGIQTTKSCIEKCENEKNCHAWTYIPLNSTLVGSPPGTCYLKDENFMQGRLKEEGRVSGRKKCCELFF